MITYYETNILFKYRLDKRIKAHYNHSFNEIMMQRKILEEYLTYLFAPKKKFRKLLIVFPFIVGLGFFYFYFQPILEIKISKSSENDDEKEKDENKKKKKMTNIFKFNLENFDDNFEITFSKKNNIRLSDVKVNIYINKRVLMK